MKKWIIFSLMIFICSSLEATTEDVFYQIGADVDGLSSSDRNGQSIDFNDNGDRFVIGSSQSDIVRVYEWDSSSHAWLQVGSDITGLGSDVAMDGDGDRIIASNHTDTYYGKQKAGRVVRFDWDGLDWIEHSYTVGGTSSNQYFGISIDIDSAGDTIVVGASGYDGPVMQDDMGCIFIYDLNSIGDMWILRKKIEGDGGDDEFGYSVSIDSSGEYVAAGAPNAYNTSLGARVGSVVTYVDFTTDYIKMGSTIYGANAGDDFGKDVDITAEDAPYPGNPLGDIYLAVGAPYYDTDKDGNFSTSCGAAYVYVYTNTSTYASGWVQRGSIINQSLTGTSPRLGSAVAISQDGKTVALGSPAADLPGSGVIADVTYNAGYNTGLASVYEYLVDPPIWTQVGNHIIGESRSDVFGSSVDINKAGNRIAIGAYGNDGNGISSGHVRVYERKNLTEALVDVKTEINNLIASLNSLVLNNDAISDNTAGRIENANNISVNQSSIASNVVDIQSVSAQAASNNAAIASHDSDFANISNQIASNVVDIQSVFAQAASNSVAIASHDSDFDNIEAQMTSTSNTLTAAVDNIINLQGALANLLNLEVAAREAADATLSNRIDIVESETNGTPSVAQAKAMMKDLRSGSTIIDVDEGIATVSLTLEETSDIDGSNWTSVAESLEVNVSTSNNVEFFRFRMD